MDLGLIMTDEAWPVTGWFTQNFDARNMSVAQVKCALAGTSLEIFDEEYYQLMGTTARAISDSSAGESAEGVVFQHFTPNQSSYVNYPDIVRMTDVSSFLETNCALTGENLQKFHGHARRSSRE